MSTEIVEEFDPPTAFIAFVVASLRVVSTFSCWAIKLPLFGNVMIADIKAKETTDSPTK